MVLYDPNFIARQVCIDNVRNSFLNKQLNIDALWPTKLRRLEGDLNYKTNLNDLPPKSFKCFTFSLIL